MYNLLVIVTMWNKVNELSRQSYSQAQIAQLLGVYIFRSMFGQREMLK